MKSNIQKSLREWFPNAFPEEKTKGDYTDYEVLNHFANYTLKLIKENNKELEKEPFKIISILYLNGGLHDRNAIENEFLSVFAKEESSGSLKLHLDLMPKDLRPIYLKTILEN